MPNSIDVSIGKSESTERELQDRTMATRDVMDLPTETKRDIADWLQRDRAVVTSERTKAASRAAFQEQIDRVVSARST